MSESLQLLFPCCSTRSIESGNAQKNEKRFTSASAHLATAVALAIIVGTAAALAVYFLHNGVIKWTALAGGGGALVSGTAIYTMLRCACGTLPQKFSIGIKTRDWQLVEEGATLSGSLLAEHPFDERSGSSNRDEEEVNDSIESKLQVLSQDSDSGSAEGSGSENGSILSDSAKLRATFDSQESVVDRGPVKIYVDRDENLSREDKLKLFQENLNSGSLIMLRSDDAYSEIKNITPTQELPYSHFVIPIQIGDCIFEVEPISLGSTKKRGSWETVLHLRYLGESFEGFADAFFHLEELLAGGPFYFAPGCFQVAHQQWSESFEKWNQNQKGQQQYLTRDDLVTFARSEFEIGTGILEIRPSRVYGIGDPDEERHYYLPDYRDFEFNEANQGLLITRSQASPLVDVECIDYISDALYAKMHAQTCRIPLKEGLDCYNIEYRAETKMLVIRGKIRS